MNYALIFATFSAAGMGSGYSTLDGLYASIYGKKSLARHITGYFRDQSLEAISHTGTDNQALGNWET